MISPVETLGGILSGKNVISKLELALTPGLNTLIHRDSGCGNFKELEQSRHSSLPVAANYSIREMKAIFQCGFLTLPGRLKFIFF